MLKIVGCKGDDHYQRFPKMKKAAVTGGGGYIGGKLCSALLEKGYTVTALDTQFLSGEETSGIKKVQVSQVTQLHHHVTFIFTGRYQGHDMAALSFTGIQR